MLKYLIDFACMVQSSTQTNRFCHDKENYLLNLAVESCLYLMTNDLWNEG